MVKVKVICKKCGEFMSCSEITQEGTKLDEKTFYCLKCDKRFYECSNNSFDLIEHGVCSSCREEN